MKSKVLLSSILTIVLCLSLIAGSTFALFSSESKVNVAVNSATVKVEAIASDLTVGSTLGAPIGSAELVGNTLTLINLVPGDYATFSINIDNQSNVAINFRTVISVASESETDLFSGLVFTVDGVELNTVDEEGNLLVADWAALAAGEGDKTVTVKVYLPETAGNEYQNKTCTITYIVEAVQGNYTPIA